MNCDFGNPFFAVIDVCSQMKYLLVGTESIIYL